MDRFLEHLRQPVADYDCVAFPEHEIRALRERISIDTELEVQWQWDYAGHVGGLSALYERGKPAQWNAEAGGAALDRAGRKRRRHTRCAPVRRSAGRGRVPARRNVREAARSQVRHGASGGIRRSST